MRGEAVDRGYRIGGTVKRPPWPVGWENDGRVNDGHRHEWESVLLGPEGGHRLEEVCRCSLCHAPRCGHVGDDDPCMERRHHPGPHHYLSGGLEPVGGYCYRPRPVS